MQVKRSQPSRGFLATEYEKRVNDTQRKMAKAEMCAILLTTEADIYYYTGFLSQFWQSPTRPWFVVIPESGKPIAVIPEIGASCMSKGYVDDIRTWAAPHASDDGVSLLKDTLLEVAANSQHKAVGINLGRETHIRMPHNDYERLVKAVKSHLHIADATDIIRFQRMVKSEAEIDKIRYVAQCASDVFEDLPNFVGSGMQIDEVFRQFKIACLKAGVDDVSFLVGGADQGGYDDIISPPKSKPLMLGDVLILDTGCTFDGYFCDFDRNYAIGPVSDDAHKAYEVVWSATEAGLAAAKPGNRCCDVFKAMENIMQAGGALGESVGRYGHGLGIQLTEPPSHTSWDETLLMPGMVITLEPGMIFAEGKMMVHEENIVIREGGAELLSRRASPKMPVVDA